MVILTLTWVGLNFPPHLALSKIRIRIILETWNLARKYTHICISENVPFSTKDLLILLMPAFFCKKSVLFGQNKTSTESDSVRALLVNF